MMKKAVLFSALLRKRADCGTHNRSFSAGWRVIDLGLKA
jgi:hypothetical protein